MNIFLEDHELEEIKPLEPSEDKGVIVTPEVGKREEGKSDLTKEIIAMDALMVGPSEAARINGVPQSSASKYSNGKDISNNESRARILSQKYEIEDLAVAKLMHTLHIIDPDDVEKTKDKVALLNGLSNLVGKLSGDDEGKRQPQVVLNLYAPTQKTERDYKIIEA